MASRMAASRTEGRRECMATLGRVVTGRCTVHPGNLYIFEGVRGGQPPHGP